MHAFFGLLPFFRAHFEATGERKYWFLPFEIFTFLFYFLERNRLNYKTFSYHQFQNSMHFLAYIPFSGPILRQRWRQNIHFYLFRLLHSYFTFLRGMYWPIKHCHTINPKIPYIFWLIALFQVPHLGHREDKILIFPFWYFYIRILLFWQESIELYNIVIPSISKF